MATIIIETDLRLLRSATSNSASAYLSITGDAAEAIRAAALSGQWSTEGRKGNFGSAKVTATIGATTWANSVFPDTQTGGWALPVKKTVCVAEGLSEGDVVRAILTL